MPGHTHDRRLQAPRANKRNKACRISRRSVERHSFSVQRLVVIGEIVHFVPGDFFRRRAFRNGAAEVARRGLSAAGDIAALSGRMPRSQITTISRTSLPMVGSHRPDDASKNVSTDEERAALDEKITMTFESQRPPPLFMIRQHLRDVGARTAASDWVRAGARVHGPRRNRSREAASG